MFRSGSDSAAASRSEVEELKQELERFKLGADSAASATASEVEELQRQLEMFRSGSDSAAASQSEVEDLKQELERFTKLSEGRLQASAERTTTFQCETDELRQELERLKLSAGSDCTAAQKETDELKQELKRLKSSSGRDAPDEIHVAEVAEKLDGARQSATPCDSDELSQELDKVRAKRADEAARAAATALAAHSQIEALKMKVCQLQAEREDSLRSKAANVATAEAVAVEVSAMGVRLEQLQAQSAEKERRCQQLLAERNSLAELRGSSAAAGGDIELGSMPASRKGDSRQAPAVLGASEPTWVQQADVPLAILSRQLSASPLWRRVFFGYIVILHLWVFIVVSFGHR
ncbi:unnamed protein product [Polarella glacialis]|uniref:Golgin-84 n=1 Tax=Polarella glacialis TaxID=89957 RepID=A0A813GML6_POLGL|nr:unnamed protein product [Polarella glacialis]